MERPESVWGMLFLCLCHELGRRPETDGMDHSEMNQPPGFNTDCSIGLLCIHSKVSNHARVVGVPWARSETSSLRVKCLGMRHRRIVGCADPGSGFLPQVEARRPCSGSDMIRSRRFTDRSKRLSTVRKGLSTVRNGLSIRMTQQYMATWRHP